MQTATYVALQEQTVINRSMDVLANNLANMSTTGFKGERSLFQTYLTKGPNGQVVAFARDIGTIRDTQEGNLVTTGNALDTAIDGDGYFTVNTADGTRYTRNGRFQINPQQQLVNADGQSILDDQGAPITLPPNSGRVTISDTGTVSNDTGPIAKLGIVVFTNPQALESTGNSLFSATDTPAPDTNSKIRQGMLESSTVQPITEMNKLMKLQRAYTSVQDILDSEDTRLKNAIDKLSKVA